MSDPKLDILCRVTEDTWIKCTGSPKCGLGLLGGFLVFIEVEQCREDRKAGRDWENMNVDLKPNLCNSLKACGSPWCTISVLMDLMFDFSMMLI